VLTRSTVGACDPGGVDRPMSDWIGYLAIAGLAMSLGSTSAKAASANEVLPACKLYLSVLDRHGAVSQAQIAHLMDAGECLGAVYAMLNVSTALTDPLKFCPPSDTQAEQGVRAVVAYIEKRPERGWEDFTTIALEALRFKWPCP
jgi:hypothetical protein